MFWESNPRRWTAEEKAELSRLYPEATQEDILATFPDREWESIKQYASRKMKLRRLRDAPGNPKRTISATAAARLIGMSPTHFKKFHAKNIPHDQAASGGYLFDPQEVKDWYRQGIMEGHLQDKGAKRLPIEEGSTRLRQILKALPMASAELAEKMGISLGVFRNYLEGRFRIPVSLLTEAEAILMNFQYGMLETKHTPVIEASKELHSIKEALGLTRKTLAEALRIPENTLTNYLYPKTGKITVVPTKLLKRARKLLETRAPQRHRSQDPTPEMMVQALQQAGGVRGKAAKILGLSSPRFNSLLQAYDMELLAKPRYALDRITKQDLINALEKTGGNKSAAARELGIDRVTLYKLARLAGILN